MTPRTRDLTRTVIGYLNALIVAGWMPLVVTRDDIEDHVIAEPQWHGRYVRDTLQRVMNRLADAGLLERVQNYCGQSSHSVLTVEVGQRERLRRIVRAVDDVAAGDTGAIKAGVRAGRALLADPGRVRALMGRGFGSSKQVTNPVTRENKKRLVLAALAAGRATTDLERQLTTALTKALLGQTLGELVRGGQVQALPQCRSPQKLWAVLT